MTDNHDNLDVMFYQLVLSLQASSMQHLGKVMSQVTGKIERNLEAAKYSIDMLEMLQRKTANNLGEEEKKLLDHVLYELRMNYVDEANKKDDPETAEAAVDSDSAQASPDTEEASAPDDPADTDSKD